MAKKRCKWEIFNARSSADCDICELAEHSLENERLLRTLELIAVEEDGLWVVKSSYEDSLHRKRKASYRLIPAFGLRDLLNEADLSNGFDIGCTTSILPDLALVAHGANCPLRSLGGHATQVMRCRLLNQATSRLVEERDEVPDDEIKLLFRARERQVLLEPCIERCKQAAKGRYSDRNRLTCFR